MSYPVKVLAMLAGVFCLSTAVIWIKLSSIEPLQLAGLRMLLAALVLSPVFFYVYRKYEGAFTRRHLMRCILPALMLSAHFITWIIGVRFTTAANSTLIINMLPIVMPFVMFWMIGERITRGEIVGTFVAVTGVIVLGIGSAQTSSAFLRGDLICAFSILFLVAYLALARKNGDFVNIWLYVTPIYAIGGLFTLLVAIPVSGLPKHIPAIEWAYLLGLTLVPTIIGHTLFNWGMRNLRGQLVAVLNLGQFLFAAVLAYFILRERLQGLFFTAAILVITGALVAIRSQPNASTKV